jgi:hypothetical protein
MNHKRRGPAKSCHWRSRMHSRVRRARPARGTCKSPIIVSPGGFQRVGGRLHRELAFSSHGALRGAIFQRSENITLGLPPVLTPPESASI